MSCVRSGGLAALFSFLTLAALVACLLPMVNWAKHGSDDISLWTHSCGTNCSMDNPGKHDFKNERTAERDGAIAGSILGALCAGAAMIAVCCQKKGVTSALLTFSCVFAAAAVGCFVRFKIHTLDESLESGSYKFTYGFGVACVSVLFSFMGLVSSCCMRKNDGYEFLA
eukprot:m.476683 g.476683  ORF g.476683 m.476683 type:complete len:169 (+) comp20613_c0_seq1:252-758(+)